MKIQSTIALLMLCAATQAQTRHTLNIRQWEFSRDSIQWNKVNIPHDWAIAGPFDKKWDLQNVAITQNGEKVASEKSGRSGALPWIGQGWYRTKVNVDDAYEVRDLVFDGAMAEPTVYVNGKRAGYWAYGYNAFRIQNAQWKKGENDIVVHLQNVEESSRWYPGAGLYRPVTLVEKQSVNIDEWESWFRTDTIYNVDANRKDGNTASARTSLHIAISNRDFKSLHVAAALKDAAGNIVALSEGDTSAEEYNGDMSLKCCSLWTPETPYLYTLEVKVECEGKAVDMWQKKVGLRTVRVSAQNGFQLNGKSRKIKGVCLHHDLGMLGAAVNRDALVRQVLLLKQMGADAIRTSHNMPSQMQMEVYDSLGMMVMAESFDMWIYPKCKNGYAKFFKEWADKDIENLVKANRNHPSVVMWSIGNEIPEQWSKEGQQIAEHLQNICHRLDPMTPVTQGMDKAENALKSGFAQTMDVPGFNYRVYKYGKSIKQLPKGFLLGSETASTVSSRGVYKFPVEWSNKKTWPDGQCNGYDTEWCGWSNLPEEDFLANDDADFTIGQFVWTGFDYLGEPTPYDNYWPSRSSYFGIFDLAGLPKDRYYLYRSVWNTKEHTLHLLPHWTWSGREGQVTPVFCYTDYPEAELFVNGKSQGRIAKDLTKKGEWTTGKAASSQEAKDRAKRYRLMWDNVKYEPGELKVVAYDKDGNKAATETVKTAGKPHHLKMEPFFGKMKADGESMEFVTVTMVDKDGNMVPMCSDKLNFEVSGAADFRGVCNGDATSLEVFTNPTMHLFSGQLVVALQSDGRQGTISLTAIDQDNRNIKETLKLKATK